jgi:hypothetical protein
MYVFGLRCSESAYLPSVSFISGSNQKRLPSAEESGHCARTRATLRCNLARTLRSPFIFGHPTARTEVGALQHPPSLPSGWSGVVGFREGSQYAGMTAMGRTSRSPARGGKIRSRRFSSVVMRPSVDRFTPATGDARLRRREPLSVPPLPPSAAAKSGRLGREESCDLQAAAQ